MKITQTLRKPANWQDFESLCLLLWGAEWKSDDLKKNGRNGQKQHGVDISGHKDDEDDYSGIQCKCKPGNELLTKHEIDEEIENAKQFKPALKRLVFATTADKDSPIEEYVRLKDLENRRNGLFSIDIRSWEDIIVMLERNKSVLNTYLDIVADDFAVSIGFGNGSNETVIRPRYERIYYMEPVSQDNRRTGDMPETITNVAVKSSLSLAEKISKISGNMVQAQIVTPRLVRGHKETNHSFCPLRLMMENTGLTPIDDYKVYFSFNNEHVAFTRTNVKKELLMPEITFHPNVSNITLDDGSGVCMYGSSLIPGDSSISDMFFVHFPVNTEKVKITWKLLSRHYSEEGQMMLKVEPEFEDKVNYSKEKSGMTEYGDYIDKIDITD